MFSSLKFILIVIIFHFQLSSSIQDAEPDTASQVKTILMFCIAGGILVTMIILMCVVICLYRKVSYALRCCDDCNLYGNFDTLPPCLCDVNEGL
ncbi:protein FAM24B [Talpa occidentalis]|uniref:protein FAM24B n=1 Tax=Talpa occidentalis TaxID=50954 RepID=UPI00188E83A0|nr:protein FAM24B [Talpa occidentalis]